MTFLDVFLKILAILGIIAVGTFIIVFLSDLHMVLLHNNYSLRQVTFVLKYFDLYDVTFMSKIRVTSKLLVHKQFYFWKSRTLIIKTCMY